MFKPNLAPGASRKVFAGPREAWTIAESFANFEIFRYFIMVGLIMVDFGRFREVSGGPGASGMAPEKC